MTTRTFRSLLTTCALLVTAAFSATLSAPTVIRGTNWNQVCDSQGSHNPASIVVSSSGTSVVWTPTVRQPGQSWDNVYIWQGNQISYPTETSTRFAYTVPMELLDSQSLDSMHAFEFEVQAVRSGWLYNMAWQIRKDGSGLSLWTFDFGRKSWVDTGIRRPANDFTVGAVSEWVALYEINGTGPHHLGIYVNGDYYPVDIQRSAIATKENDYTNFAFQLDGSNKAEAISAWVDPKLVTF